MKKRWIGYAAFMAALTKLFNKTGLMALVSAVTLYTVPGFARSGGVPGVAGSGGYSGVVRSGGNEVHVRGQDISGAVGSWGYPGVAGPGGYPGVAGYGGYYPRWRHTWSKGYSAEIYTTSSGFVPCRSLTLRGLDHRCSFVPS